jgi:hypothetical protein
MEEGRRWRQSREAERFALAVMVIANRIPFNERGVKYKDLLRSMFPEYEE